MRVGRLVPIVVGALVLIACGSGPETTSPDATAMRHENEQLCQAAGEFVAADQNLARVLTLEHRVIDDAAIRWRASLGQLRFWSRGSAVEDAAVDVQNLSDIQDATMVLEVAATGPGVQWSAKEVDAGSELSGALVEECGVKAGSDGFLESLVE